MFIGCIGLTFFHVTEGDLFTFRDLARESKIKFAVHSVLEGKPRVQHIGSELETVSLTVILENTRLSGWGSPDDRIRELRDKAHTGEEQALVFGIDYWGKWIITDVRVRHAIFHNGFTLRGTVELSLLEYN